MMAPAARLILTAFREEMRDQLEQRPDESSIASVLDRAARRTGVTRQRVFELKLKHQGWRP